MQQRTLLHSHIWERNLCDGCSWYHSHRRKKPLHSHSQEGWTWSRYYLELQNPPCLVGQPRQRPRLSVIFFDTLTKTRKRKRNILSNTDYTILSANSAWCSHEGAQPNSFHDTLEEVPIFVAPQDCLGRSPKNANIIWVFDVGWSDIILCTCWWIHGFLAFFICRRACQPTFISILPHFWNVVHGCFKCAYL